MPRNTYAVIEGNRLIGTSSRIALARKHRTGIAGRRIIRVGASQVGRERIQMRDMQGGTFYIYGVEVT